MQLAQIFCPEVMLGWISSLDLPLLHSCLNSGHYPETKGKDRPAAVSKPIVVVRVRRAERMPVGFAMESG